MKARYERIDQLLKERTISRNELARRIGMSQNTLNSMFVRRNKKPFSIEVAYQIAEILNTSINEIVEFEQFERRTDIKMEDIQDLVKQKKEIEQKINELKNKSRIIGNFKFGVNASKEGKWGIWSRVPGREKIYKTHEYREVERWSLTFVADTKEQLLNAIPDLIKNLQQYYDENKEGE